MGIYYISDYEILAVIITDADRTRPNSNIDVRIQEDDVPFQISNSWVISLKSGQPLDYDVASSFVFTLVAEDGGRDGSTKTSSASVTISLLSGTLLRLVVVFNHNLTKIRLLQIILIFFVFIVNCVGVLIAKENTHVAKAAILGLFDQVVLLKKEHTIMTY